MKSLIIEKQFFRSCEILFGSDLNVSKEFFDYLRLSDLKTAYRKRAMETHPDRIAGENQLQQQRNHDPFHAVQEAYEQLLLFLKTKEAGIPAAASRKAEPVFSVPRKTTTSSPSPPRTERQRPSDNGSQRKPFPQQTLKPIILLHDAHNSTGCANTESLYQGPLPPRHLLFGRFLYYSGLANWRTIAQILIWQRLERPRLGELGQRYGLFHPDDITRILRNKAPFQPFGQVALGMGILTELQLHTLIAQQQRLQKKFGTILLEKKLVTPHELEKLLQAFELHNADIRAQQQRWSRY
jgi:hypothetical protein